MGKKKSGKKNWKPVPVDNFIDANVKKTNWADEVDQEYKDSDLNDYTPKPVVLPTAPRASRASDFDETKVPQFGPFQIHVSNIPYELDDQELADFFDGLQIKSIRMPKEEGKRAKGYGYVEFVDRQSLIAALNKPDTVIKNRPIKIELSTGDSGRGGMNRGGRGGNRDGGMRSGDMGDPDRTAGNWRSGPRADYEDRPNFDRGGGGGGGFGSGGRRDFSSGSGGGFSRGGFDREERGGFSRDDRGGGGGFREERDRGFGGDRDRGDRFQRDDRRRDDFDRGGYRDREDRGGFRDNRSRGGFDDDRREERGGGGGSWRDGASREAGGGGGFNRGSFEDRRDDRGPPPARYGDRGPSRRDDLPPPDRAPPVERKKLNLQPRSVNTPAENKPAVAAQSAIFGGAKPVDTTAREREVEERLMRGDDGTEKIRSGPSSTSGGSVKDVNEGSERGGEREKPVEPAPPPKENAWHRKPTSPMNNGRTSPSSGDDRSDTHRSWGRGEPKRPEPRHTDDQRSTKPPPKTGPPGGPDRGRTRDDRPPNKSREPRNFDDLSKMPKLVENKTPNYVGANKFVALEDEDTAE